MGFKFNFFEKVEIVLYLIVGILFLFGILSSNGVLIVRALILILVSMILQMINLIMHFSRFFEEPEPPTPEERIERLRMHGRIDDPENK